MTIYLASSSPRRAELCRQLGLRVQIVPGMEVDETPLRGELPRRYAERMALAKARRGAELAELMDELVPGNVLIAGDTVVALGRRILPGTDNPDIAQGYLEQLSGRRHRVWGGLAVWVRVGDLWQSRLRISETRVRLRRIDLFDIRAYIKTREWIGCAGGYAIQGQATRFVAHIQGSHANVVGLDTAQLWQLLPPAVRREG